MKILLISIGTRGDMEPFLAIGKILKEREHEVTCQLPEQFRTIVEDAGFYFETLGTEFMEMLESDTGKFALGGGGSSFKKIGAFMKLAKIQVKNNQLMIERQQETVTRLNPDRIVHHGKAMYPVIWGVKHPGQTIYISPVPFLHYVKGHTHTAFHNDFGTFFNKLTFKLADWGIKKTIISAIKWLKIKGISKSQIAQVLQNHKVIYTISPQLFERPKEWNNNMKVLGYHERDKTTNWQPSPELLSFLDKHKKILFVTFGSMTNPKPSEKTNVLLRILKQNNIPAIFNISSGGLTEPSTYDKELFHFVSSIPYDWVFPKMYAVIHHGGSGTTHMATKYGCVSLIIPHIVDQFIWNQIVSEKQIGPKGIKISKISETNLAPKIIEMMNNIVYKKNVEQIALEMQKENMLEEELYKEIIS